MYIPSHPSKEKIVIITIVTLGLTLLTYSFSLAPHNLENFWRTFWDALILLSGFIGILELIISVDIFFRSLDGNPGLSGWVLTGWITIGLFVYAVKDIPLKKRVIYIYFFSSYTAMMFTSLAIIMEFF